MRSRPLVFLTLANMWACTQINPAFDEIAEAGEDSGTTEKPGDGDGDGGDGDGGDGDGDGDSGDGDGGDGDGGDGDGGDGDSGDGDGDGGDGDGDGDAQPGCEPGAVNQNYEPFLLSSVGNLHVQGAPGFALAPPECLLLMICDSEQFGCEPDLPHMAKAYSSGAVFIGQGADFATSLQLRFHPGLGLCNGAVLDIDPSQFIEIEYWDGQGFALLPVRLPCAEQFDVPLYIASDGSTFWDPGLTDPAALW